MFSRVIKVVGRIDQLFLQATQGACDYAADSGGISRYSIQKWLAIAAIVLFWLGMLMPPLSVLGILLAVVMTVLVGAGIFESKTAESVFAKHGHVPYTPWQDSEQRMIAIVAFKVIFIGVLFFTSMSRHPVGYAFLCLILLGYVSACTPKRPPRA